MHLLSCSEETKDVNYQQKTFMDKSEQTLVKLYLYYENKEYTIGWKFSLTFTQGRNSSAL